MSAEGTTVTGAGRREVISAVSALRASIGDDVTHLNELFDFAVKLYALPKDYKFTVTLVGGNGVRRNFVVGKKYVQSMLSTLTHQLKDQVPKDVTRIITMARPAKRAAALGTPSRPAVYQRSIIQFFLESDLGWLIPVNATGPYGLDQLNNNRFVVNAVSNFNGVQNEPLNQWLRKQAVFADLNVASSVILGSLFRIYFRVHNLHSLAVNGQGYLNHENAVRFDDRLNSVFGGAVAQYIADNHKKNAGKPSKLADVNKLGPMIIPNVLASKFIVRENGKGQYIDNGASEVTKAAVKAFSDMIIAEETRLENNYKANKKVAGADKAKLLTEYETALLNIDYTGYANAVAATYNDEATVNVLNIYAQVFNLARELHKVESYYDYNMSIVRAERDRLRGKASAVRSKTNAAQKKEAKRVAKQAKTPHFTN